MSKTRSFSIYLLKEGFDATNTLKDEHGLTEGVTANNLLEGAKLYALIEDLFHPWWKLYFNISYSKKPKHDGVLKGAIIFLPAGERTFAITFGHVFHNLKSESYEYDFGLRVTLNSVEPDKLKSLDALSPENARRQRTQLPVGSELANFNFDFDSTILKSLTGKVKEDYKSLFKNATGASSIRISSEAEPDGLAELCAKLLELYADETFKTTFPDIQNISPVRDPVIVDALNAKLVVAIKSKNENLILTVPEIVNYSDELYATFSGAGGGLVYDDIFIDRYYEYLENTDFDLNNLNVDALKKHCLVLTNETGQPRGDKPNILKCLIFDTTLDGSPGAYHLCEGNWYLVDGDYVSELSTYLDPLCKDTALPNYNHANEGAYNEAGSAALDTRLCMDKGNISPKGQTQVEPCDIFEVVDGVAVLHHVKRSTVSATLSHLFNQGLNSIQLVRDNEEALAKLKSLAEAKAPNGEEAVFSAAFNDNKYKVIFQIITHKDKAAKSLNLPLFSRISLKRTMKELRRMGIEREFCFVKNDAPKSDGKAKKRKPRSKAQKVEAT